MPHIQSLEIYPTDLPFKKAFKHAAAERKTSDSIVLKCNLDTGTAGYGECLPRQYVTRESRQGACDLLQHRILPQLLGKSFDSFEEVKGFLTNCNGKAPVDWVGSDVPQTAAWCAVDLALLDAFGKEFKESVFPENKPETDLKYSAVLSAGKGWSMYKTLWKMKLGGIRSVKIKVENELDLKAMEMICKTLGQKVDVRVDANMAWNEKEAIGAMRELSKFGIESFEQPLPVDELDQSAETVRQTGLQVMADESLHDDASLDAIIEKKAFTSVNIRISKCGGLMAALNRCHKAANAGLIIQVGCQVGESSLLSAAHLALLHLFPNVRYAEGCFGLHLLREDPFRPLMQFGYGGRWPSVPRAGGQSSYGLNVHVDNSILNRHAVNYHKIAS